MTKRELADQLERFIGDRPGCDRWFFDDFTSASPSLAFEPIRDRLRAMEPPLSVDEQDEIRNMIKELRFGAAK